MANEEKLRDYPEPATANLHRTRRQLRELAGRAQEPIAVVGMRAPPHPGDVAGGRRRRRAGRTSR
ncbi:hypothetical protein [Amycolatopsis sp. lyj-346]|uniref:hypothetical protein n=1 Tax=Amycolatopsis sp. lyj-346 TaxID=2789289 RepID=UPI00397B6D26